MKKIHLTLIIIISFALLLSVGFGLLTIYVNQKELPKGVVLSDWNVGGQPADNVLSELEDKLQTISAMTIQLQSDALKGERVSINMLEAGVTFQAEAFRAGVQQLFEGSLWERAVYRRNFKQEWHIATEWDRDVLKKRFNLAWEKEHFGEPVPAVRSISKDDIVRYTPEKTAYRIHWAALYERLSAALPNEHNITELQQQEHQGIVIELPLIRQKPDVTVKTLQAEGIARKVVEFSTSLGASAPGRIHNVSAAAKTVDGMILKPGDEFNYAHIIDTAKKEYGFKEAPVIVNGKLVPGIGGGICQVSSTVYHAALLMGLDITERRNHSLPVSYLPKGQDATFAEGAINFRFRNNTDKHLLILADVSNDTLTLKMFGTFPENTEYAIESNTIETLPSPEKVIHNTALPPGFKQVVQNGKPGYVVETYRTKKVNGEVVEKVKISKDTYRAQNSIVAINPSNEIPMPNTKEPSKEEVVEDGVSTP
ncbi:VanW family protein [Paenibacillus sp. JCM 10914]|uniref:VanW family protein n=1 Tax=Paenibacillus sp. JCM 10914 TaxID=1236974 RepID=UPI0003CC7875|nr:VanW family protein [Paenibacillus sp. JCM 10914]GAE09131.1 vancomycin B-type resistance protein VanW [Paenibacillus sp. JCM 10914]